MKPMGFRGLAMKRNAFTLMEMLLALALLTAVAGAVIPNLLHWHTASLLNRSVDRVVLAVGRARAGAASRGMMHLVEYWPGTADFRVSSDRPGPLLSLYGSALFQVHEERGIPDRPSPRDQHVVRFDVDGRTQDSVIRITDGQRSMVIRIDRLTGDADTRVLE
jgi:prepilin-type N-terminal cleavage/methylation domain-containing protein